MTRPENKNIRVRSETSTAPPTAAIITASVTGAATGVASSGFEGSTRISLGPQRAVAPASAAQPATTADNRTVGIGCPTVSLPPFDREVPLPLDGAGKLSI